MFYTIYIVKHQIQQQTSTPTRVETSTGGCRSLVETSTKFRPPMVEIWLKFLPNFDTLRHWMYVNALKHNQFSCQPNCNVTHVGICDTAEVALNYNIALSAHSCTIMNRRVISCPLVCALMYSRVNSHVLKILVYTHVDSHILAYSHVLSLCEVMWATMAF